MFKVINPFNQEVIAEIQEDTRDTIQQKLMVARKAQPAWSSQSVESRISVINKFAEILKSSVDQLADVLTSEMGKPLSQAKNEINGTLGRIEFFVDNVARLSQTKQVATGDTAEEISFEPLGVIANISAWNYPYFVGSNVIIPALLTGNAVLYKPSEITALTGNLIGEKLVQAGVPKEIFHVIQGGGQVGEALVAASIDGLFFTGSKRTGMAIAKQAADKLIPVQMELGGKDPIYVTNDVDASKVAAGIADGAFYNTGQSCCSVERIYVNEDIADEFISAFCAEVRTYKVGDPKVDGTYVGPLARREQLAFLESQVANAVELGATLEVGGSKVPETEGNFFAPTVLTNVTHEMVVMREESFGPIIGIQKVSSDQEALEYMNDSEYGLTAGVYCKDEARARKLMQQLEAGSVYWNCCDRVSPRLPWTGYKYSGTGSTLSEIGISCFMKPKAWHLRS